MKIALTFLFSTALILATLTVIIVAVLAWWKYIMVPLLEWLHL